MYKAIYFNTKVNNKLYEKFISDCAEYFGLNLIKKNEESYFLENREMLIKFERTLTHVLMFNKEDTQAIKRVKEYFR